MTNCPDRDIGGRRGGLRDLEGLLVGADGADGGRGARRLARLSVWRPRGFVERRRVRGSAGNRDTIVPALLSSDSGKVTCGM